MAEPGAPSLEGMPVPEVNPTLDQTRAALGKLQDQLRSGSDLMARLQAGFDRDLDELGIDDPAKRAEYAGLFRLGVQERLALGSKAHTAIIKYTRDMDNMPGLKAVIEAKDPQGKFKGTIADALPALGGWSAVIAFFTKLLSGDENEGDEKEGVGWIKAIASLFGYKDEKTADSQPNPAQPAATPAAAAATGQEQQRPQNVIPASLTDLHAFIGTLNASEPNLLADFATLKQALSEADINAHARQINAGTGGAPQIYAAVRGKLGAGEVLPKRLLDIQFQAMPPAEVQTIIGQISNSSNPGKQDIRHFLDDIHANTDRSAASIESLARRHKLA